MRDPGPAPRVLIIEDDADTVRGLEEICRALGHRPEHVMGRKAAQERLRAQVFDYVLLDLQIPNEADDLQPRVANGMALLQWMRVEFPERFATGHYRLQVLVISGNAKAHENVVAAMQFPFDANDFIRKPLSTEGADLEHKIAACMSRIRAGRNDAAGFVVNDGYTRIKFRGETYKFSGLGARIIEYLHRAWLAGDPEVRTSVMMERIVGKSDRTLAQHFSKRKDWKDLIGYGDGFCWLKIDE